MPILDYTLRMPNVSLSQSILHTLSYFDLFDYPLTASELWRFLWQPPASISYAEFSAHLGQMVHHSSLTMQHGFYFLPGREAIVSRRQNKIVPSDQWLARAKAAARIMSWIPFLKSIIVCNSVGAERASTKSDIDLLIITAPGYVWFVRFWCNVLLRLTGRRTYGVHTAGRVCLSFFIDTDHFDRSGERVAADDIHFAYWIVQMMPVFDPEMLYDQFLLSNQWLKSYLPHIFEDNAIGQFKKKSTTLYLKPTLERLLQTKLGRFFNHRLMTLQIKRVSARLKPALERSNPDVVLSESVIKLHEHDTRRIWRERWLQKASAYK